MCVKQRSSIFHMLMKARPGELAKMQSKSEAGAEAFLTQIMLVLLSEHTE